MQKNGKMMPCLYCGKLVYIPKGRQEEFKYCSKSCHAKVNLCSLRSQKKIKRKYGENHANWKGGSINSNGYRVISILGKRQYEHRYIMEQFIKRKLTSTENIHHINHNKVDNRIENLKLYSNLSSHTIEENHKKLSKYNEKDFKLCIGCKKKFYRKEKKLKFNKAKFCTHSCALINIKRNYHGHLIAT